MRKTIKQMELEIARRDATIQALRERIEALVEAFKPILKPFVEELAEEVVNDRIDTLSIG